MIQARRRFHPGVESAVAGAGQIVLSPSFHCPFKRAANTSRRGRGGEEAAASFHSQTQEGFQQAGSGGGGEGEEEEGATACAAVRRSVEEERGTREKGARASEERREKTREKDRGAWRGGGGGERREVERAPHERGGAARPGPCAHGCFHGTGRKKKSRAVPYFPPHSRAGGPEGSARRISLRTSAHKTQHARRVPLWWDFWHTCWPREARSRLWRSQERSRVCSSDKPDNNNKHIKQSSSSSFLLLFLSLPLAPLYPQLSPLPLSLPPPSLPHPPHPLPSSPARRCV